MAPGDPPSSAWGVGNPGKLKAPPALLTWDIVKKKMPWNIVILLGGGFALAKGSEVRDPTPSPAPVVGDPVTEKEGPCFSRTRGSLTPHVGAPWWAEPPQQLERQVRALSEGEKTQGPLPVGCSKPKRRQDFSGREGLYSGPPRPSPHPLPHGECRSSNPRD